MSKILSKSVHNKTTVTVVLSCDYNGSKYNNCLSYITENIVGKLKHTTTLLHQLAACHKEKHCTLTDSGDSSSEIFQSYEL